MSIMTKETEAAKVQHAYYIVYKTMPILTLITKVAYDIIDGSSTRLSDLPDLDRWKKKAGIET